MKKKIKKINKNLIIYQAKNGAIQFRGDFSQDTIWATQKQIAGLFEIERSVVTKHIGQVFKDGEVDKKSNVQKMHIANSDKPVKVYSLDIILAIGYRTRNSSKAIEFRRWASKVLKDHLLNGYTINKKILKNNHKEFLKVVEDLRVLLKDNKQISSSEVLELVKTFSNTWFSLDQYDKDAFPEKGFTKKKLKISVDELYDGVKSLKTELLRKKEATELFAQERKKDSLEGILGNIFQSAFGQEMYPTLEEKAAQLLYFVIKNHPFSDGNKRTGAFSFIWFLNKAKLKSRHKITPETLTALTLLIAESKPSDKDKMVGLVLLLLKK